VFLEFELICEKRGLMRDFFATSPDICQVMAKLLELYSQRIQLLLDLAIIHPKEGDTMLFKPEHVSLILAGHRRMRSWRSPKPQAPGPAGGPDGVGDG
jgi:hypothetical protein